LWHVRDDPDHQNNYTQSSLNESHTEKNKTKPLLLVKEDDLEELRVFSDPGD
jgi:hypothetical protein